MALKELDQQILIDKLEYKVAKRTFDSTKVGLGIGTASILLSIIASGVNPDFSDLPLKVAVVTEAILAVDSGCLLIELFERKKNITGLIRSQLKDINIESQKVLARVDEADREKLAEIMGSSLHLYEDSQIIGKEDKVAQDIFSNFM